MCRKTMSNATAIASFPDGRIIFYSPHMEKPCSSSRQQQQTVTLHLWIINDIKVDTVFTSRFSLFRCCLSPFYFSCLKKLIPQLNKAKKTETISEVNQHILSSHTHMIINRLYNNNQRKYEFIIYDHLYRYFKFENNYFEVCF